MEPNNRILLVSLITFSKSNKLKFKIDWMKFIIFWIIINFHIWTIWWVLLVNVSVWRVHSMRETYSSNTMIMKICSKGMISNKCLRILHPKKLYNFYGISFYTKKKWLNPKTHYFLTIYSIIPIHHNWPKIFFF